MTSCRLIFQVVALLLGILLIMLTKSRGALLAFGFGILAWAFMKRIRLTLMMLGVLVIAAAATYPFWPQRLHRFSRNDPSVCQRAEVFIYALHVLGYRPWTGLGPNVAAYGREDPHDEYYNTDLGWFLYHGNLKRYLDEYEPQCAPAGWDREKWKSSFMSFVKRTKTMENSVLRLLLGGGLICVLTMLFFIVLAWLTIARTAWRGSGARAAQARFIAAALLAAAVHCMTFEAQAWPHLNTLFFSLLGGGVALTEIPEEKES